MNGDDNRLFLSSIFTYTFFVDFFRWFIRILELFSHFDEIGLANIFVLHEKKENGVLPRRVFTNFSYSG